MNKPTKSQVFVSVFNDMHESSLKAEAMSTEALFIELANLQLEGGEHIASLESAVNMLRWKLRFPRINLEQQARV